MPKAPSSAQLRAGGVAKPLGSVLPFGRGSFQFAFLAAVPPRGPPAPLQSRARRQWRWPPPRDRVLCAGRGRLGAGGATAPQAERRRRSAGPAAAGARALRGGAAGGRGGRGGRRARGAGCVAAFAGSAAPIWARSRAAGTARSCTSASSCSTASASSSGRRRRAGARPVRASSSLPALRHFWGEIMRGLYLGLRPLLSLQRTFIERFLNTWTGRGPPRRAVASERDRGPSTGRDSLGVAEPGWGGPAAPGATARSEGRSALFAPPRKGSFESSSPADQTPAGFRCIWNTRASF